MSAPKPKAIGFRVEPTKIHWAVVEGSAEQPILTAADTLPSPKGWSEAESLQWYRVQVLSLYEQYDPPVAVIRDAEASRFANVQSLQRRCRIEGVIIEAAQTRGISVTTGRLKTISANLDSKAAKKYLDAGEFRGLDWSRYGKLVQEAILAATSGMGDE